MQDKLKASGTRPGPGQQTYGCDVPDDMCYQWAEDYFRDPDAKEDHEDEEKFVPSRMLGSPMQEQTQEGGKKKKTEPKAAHTYDRRKKSLLRMGRCRCWILGWQRQAEPAKEEK